MFFKFPYPSKTSNVRVKWVNSLNKHINNYDFFQSSLINSIYNSDKIICISYLNDNYNGHYINIQFDITVNSTYDIFDTINSRCLICFNNDEKGKEECLSYLNSFLSFIKSLSSI